MSSSTGVLAAGHSSDRTLLELMERTRALAELNSKSWEKVTYGNH
jgi:hypothetical protein